MIGDANTGDILLSTLAPAFSSTLTLTNGGAFGIVEEFDGRPAEPDVIEMIRRLPTN